MPIGYKKIVNEGDRFNNWEIIQEIPAKSARIFQCKNILTGQVKPIRLCHLVSGASKGLANTGMSNSNARHGMAKTRPWNIWMGMKARCFNKNGEAYKNYGGRGIIVCKKWLSFTKFWEDMSNGYEDSMTIERIDVNGNYCKKNCKWIPKAEQTRNQRSNKIVKYNGKDIKLLDLADLCGVKSKKLYARIFTYKIPIDEAIKNQRVRRYTGIAWKQKK